MAIFFALAGCTHVADQTATPKVPTTLHLVTTSEPESLDPLLATQLDDAELASLAFDFLVDSGPHGGFVPVLAAEVPTLSNGGISRDGLTYTFHLRHGVRWQDGVPFTSADVAFTIHAVLDPRTNVAVRTGYDDIARVETPNAWTVIFHLKHRLAPFLSLICGQYQIVPAHLLAKSANINTDSFNTHPIGTGPYRFLRWDHGSRISYVANPHYFGGAPRIERIDVDILPDVTTQTIALRKHDVDFADVESSQYADLRSDADLRETTEPTNDFVALALNTQRPLLADVRMRRAIAMAIDRALITRINTHGTGTVAYADLPDEFWTTRAPLTPTPYDPKAAETLLDEMGWHTGPSGIRQRAGRPLHLDAITMSGSATSRVEDAQIQQMLRAVGIDVQFKSYAPSIYYAPASDGGPANSGRYDLADIGIKANPDPENDEIYTCASRPPESLNLAWYCNPRMDALQAASLQAEDPSVRLRYVAQIEQLAASEVPYVFLYHTPFRLVWVSTLQRTHSNPNDYWYDVRNWTFSAPSPAGSGR
ncbi:MAG TPA: peptide ABC transporter substrate-binding protein [Candidatus Acidoferrales bacterium]|nr:peptide ABC transporter substrate-binding protein [Candidatus Acidoferrales bacterium]